MSKSHRRSLPPRVVKSRESTRTTLRREGKMVHGTQGKPTHGPRGNKR